MAKSETTFKSKKARALSNAAARWSNDTACMLEYMYGESATRYNRRDIATEYPRYTASAHILKSGRFSFAGGFYMEYQCTLFGGYNYTIADGPKTEDRALNKPRTLTVEYARDLEQFRGALEFIENYMTPERFHSIVH